MKSRQIMFALAVFFGFSFVSELFGETLSHFQEKIQETFLEEAGNQNKFKEGVQTARLLGYLEFISPDSFDAFHQCLITGKAWAYLSAKKREHLLNECRISGRSISSVSKGSSEVMSGLRPAEAKKNEQWVQQLRTDVNDLRNMVEKLTKEVQNNHDRLFQSMNSLENNLKSFQNFSPSQPARPLPTEKESGASY